MNEEIMMKIKSVLPWFAAVAIVFGGYSWTKSYLENRRVESSTALVACGTTDEFETAVSKFGSTDAGGVLKLRLAKKYFDDGRYDEAAGIYDELSAKAPEGCSGIPAVGKAQCLEAKGEYDAALAAYEEFVAANPKSFLLLSARLGAVRATALKGDKDAALAKIAEIKESVKGDEVAKYRVEQVEDAVKRFQRK